MNRMLIRVVILFLALMVPHAHAQQKTVPKSQEQMQLSLSLPNYLAKDNKMKVRYGLTCAVLLASSTVSADTVLGVYIGGQGWNMDASGSFADESTFTANTTAADFSFDENTQGSAYIAIEHFVPLVPNVKVNYSQMTTDGNTLLSSSSIE